MCDGNFSKDSVLWVLSLLETLDVPLQTEFCTTFEQDA